MENKEYFNVEHVLTSKYVGWTVDKSAKIGQLCFWMHTANSINHINNVRNELIENPKHKNIPNKRHFFKIF